MRAKTRRILFSLLLVLILAVIAAVMMVIGRGHTVYLDNKTLEDYQGQEYKSFERVNITVPGEDEVIKLAKRERDMATCMGQSFHMTVEIIEKKGFILKRTMVTKRYTIESKKTTISNGPVKIAPPVLWGFDVSCRKYDAYSIPPVYFAE